MVTEDFSRLRKHTGPFMVICAAHRMSWHGKASALLVFGEGNPLVIVFFSQIYSSDTEL